MDEISVSKFKAEALAIVERASRGEQFIITKRGKPVVRISPVNEPASLLGSVEFKVADDELLSPTGDAWDAERSG